MSHRYNWSNLRRVALYAGLILEILSLPSMASLTKSSSISLPVAQDACAEVLLRLASAEAALSQEESEDAPDDFLESLEHSLSHASSQSSPIRDDCTRYFVAFNQYLGQELAQTELSDTYRLAAIVTGIGRLATFEDFSDEDRLTLVRDSLIQVNSLLVKFPELPAITNYLGDGLPANEEIVERIQRQISVQVTTLETAKESAIQLLLLESSSRNGSLIRETLAHLQQYGSLDEDSLELPEEFEITDADLREIKISWISLQVSALSGIEAVGYTFFELGPAGGASQQLQTTASFLQEQLLQEANSND